MSLGKSYDPENFESKRYDTWMKSGCFEASDESVPGQKSYCIMIPPPNVTGVLHMGHALGNTLQDALIRWRRMKGDNTLWLPGTDHAGIATQAQVEKAIAKEGKGPTGRPLTRHDLGREKFLERTWAWKNQHADEIKNQLRHLGSSYDWNRERFTMDDGLSKAVREVFVSLYHDGLIYRGERIINWCTRCRTALSDLEVLPTDRKGSLYHIQYAIEGSSQKFVIATTRPETLLGDSAVAVHPEDDRYSDLHGKSAVLPLLGRKIPIIADAYVDREFGTGALKITPAHDFNDYDLGVKHKLPMIQVMGKDGKITEEGGPYSGLKFTEAREKIVQDLKDQGLLVKVEDHAMKLGLCQRCDTVAEPIVSKQWFVKIAPLAQPAIEAVESGKIEFAPKNWEKTYFEWMYNIRDWCISRQLWWGHQIPAWYCGACEHITVSKMDVKICEKCKSPQVTRDEDVLDTWFSSALWPFSTLGWPDRTKALNTFYPTSVLETGFDIIFFWVARMIMMGLHFMKDVPFSKVYLHAMVRDEKGEKMSKTKGNVIDPLELIKKHGADPLRFTLASMAGQGRDIKLAVDRVESYRAFANKIWNATKFFHLQFEPEQGGPIAEPSGGTTAWINENFSKMSLVNQWIVSRLQTTITKTEKGLADYQLNESCQALYEFSWLELCDWYIEFSKIPLKKGGHEREETLIVLRHVLDQMLRLLHPIMPFVTEELWLSLPWIQATNTPTRKRDGQPELLTLMIQAFPEANAKLRNETAEIEIQKLKSVIEGIRNFRGENNISPKKEFAVKYIVREQAKEVASFIERFQGDILTLARITELTPIQAGTTTGKMESIIPIHHPPIDLKIGLDGLVDLSAEKARLSKEIEKVKSDLAHCQGKLTKESFVAKAPPALLEKERANESAMIKKLDELKQTLEKLGQG
jgi:valyl-tRNA synthetase